jgi:hypothetical protein
VKNTLTEIAANLIIDEPIKPCHSARVLCAKSLKYSRFILKVWQGLIWGEQ